MSADDGLRAIMRSGLPGAQWSSIETRLSARGIPDGEYCFQGGKSGWVECKSVRRGWAIGHKTGSWPFQVAWLMRRARLGGRATVAVRRRVDRGVDQLWLVDGAGAGSLAALGLRGVSPEHLLGMWDGGPRQWPWGPIMEVLVRDVC